MREIELVKGYWLSKFVDDPNIPHEAFKPEIMVFTDAENASAKVQKRLHKLSHVRVITPKGQPDEQNYRDWILNQSVLIVAILEKEFEDNLKTQVRNSKYLGDNLLNILGRVPQDLLPKERVKFNELKTRISGEDLSLKESRKKAAKLLAIRGEKGVVIKDVANISPGLRS